MAAFTAAPTVLKALAARPSAPVTGRRTNVVVKAAELKVRRSRTFVTQRTPMLRLI